VGAVNEELFWMPGWMLAREIASKNLSAVELTEQVLERIDRLDPNLNSFLTVAPEVARQQASAADLAVIAGEQLGPLHGVPISIKDSLWTKDVRTTCGSVRVWSTAFR